MASFEAKKITDKVYWVGAIDWELRDFHGYTTSRGTTYNAYLVLGEKPILIDTVKAQFYDEMMARIASVIDPKEIAYIVSNHAEMDHSGSLQKAVATIKPEKVFASKMGVKALNAHFNLDFEITEITPNEEIAFGDRKFKFIETRMLHWPDSMFTYFVDDGILFSQDGFGMHLATSQLFADENDDNVLYYEAAKYYANILLPYSSFVTRLLAQVPSLNLDIKMIAPDHGPIWRQPKDIKFILDSWQRWAEQKIYKKAVIFYDTMWNSTTTMADAIADGVISEGVKAVVMPLRASNRSDIALEILEAGALIAGSPTINQQMFPTLADIFCYLRGLKRQNLIGQAFGSFGWAGEATKLIQQELTNMNVELVADPVAIQYVPTSDDLTKCHQLGSKIAKILKSKGE